MAAGRGVRPRETSATASSTRTRAAGVAYLSTVVCLSGLSLGMPARAQTATAPLQRVEVIGITPLPGAGVPLDQVPANVQSADDGQLRRLQSLNLPDYMLVQLPSVNVNEIQGNPYQMEVNYRGFSASPLLGTPQGLSVFQDGVRVNEPFGDVVNWDLIPRMALASLSLLPGSNPLFGLNTLGGALVLQTKDGRTHAGTEVEGQVGRFGRRNLELSHGRALGARGHLFLAASVFDEDGWRDFSPSRVRQLFAKAGQAGPVASWDLSLTHADNRLIGNGLLPESMLAGGRSQVYTRPDETANRMSLLTLNGKLVPRPDLELGGTFYLRRADARTLNGDLNDDYADPELDPPGVENRTQTGQRGSGVALQATLSEGVHRLVVGVSHDRSHSHFRQTEAEGALDPTRAVVDTEEPEVDALIEGHSRTSSVFAAAVLGLRPNLQLTASGRFNETRVDTVDVGRATLGLDTELDAQGRYRKFNPALGLTWQVTPALTAYGGASQGNRAPSPIELGCSDPDNACVLPNALQSDPPLKQVVSHTLEAGLRGRLGEGLRWNASVYRSVNVDDLLFISNGRAAGYFTNFGRTQRQGVELGASQRGTRVNWSLAYSYLQAVFDDSACLVSAANSTANTSATCTGVDEIAVRPGNRLPGLPRQSLKLTVDVSATPDWRVGAQLGAYSSQFVRGNENNAHQPDGVDFFGEGRVGGYAVLNLTTSWRLAEGIELFAKLSNVFNRSYGSAGALGENALDAGGALRPPDAWRHEQFVGPGAPRSWALGLRWTLDGG
jgi:iron complex outermembrane recepter protein